MYELPIRNKRRYRSRAYGQNRQHADEVHGMKTIPPDMMEKVKEAIKK
jgi:hypothetical protein